MVLRAGELPHHEFSDLGQVRELPKLRNPESAAGMQDLSHTMAQIVSVCHLTIPAYFITHMPSTEDFEDLYGVTEE
jgi:hypothetical protein